MKECTCTAGHGQVAVGASLCTPCPTKTYKAATGIDTCSICPFGTNSSVGSDELTDCTCFAGYTAVSDGQECTACADGTYKTETGTATCDGVCPTGTSSAAGSNEQTDCKCMVGFHTPDYDGVACSPCAKGTYKNTIGIGLCQTCPGMTSSALASDDLADCKCVIGYTAASDGLQCNECAEGTYKDVTGAFVCSTCPTGNNSPTGSDEIFDCTCITGYEGNAGSVCNICPVDTYCVGGVKISCPENTHSVSGSGTLEDCVCVTGYFR
ncbi:hypothetical protein T484DRAFT_1619302 [Baffinella frigidus]|nr:hypothetical protein T484DRAFT_1619302 [Cryptophyta sp. CCMP2293]